jgi:hypothetical protein
MLDRVWLAAAALAIPNNSCKDVDLNDCTSSESVASIGP